MYKTKNIEFQCVVYNGKNGNDVMRLIYIYCENSKKEPYFVDMNGKLYYEQHKIDNGAIVQVQALKKQTVFVAIEGQLYIVSDELFNVLCEECKQ